jgi:Zinc finger, C2H2 type
MTFQCPKCELRFATDSELAWHLRTDHHRPELSREALHPDHARTRRVRSVPGAGEQPIRV